MDDLPLLDFLYADHERVASLLSQLNKTGTPKEVSEVATRKRSSNKRGGLKLGVVSYEQGGAHDAQYEARQIYDPLWNSSIELIGLIKEREGARDSTFPKIGELRLLSGTLMAFDISYLPALMEADSMSHFIARGASNDGNSDETGDCRIT